MIAVAIVRIVQVAIDDVADVVAMRNRFVAAAGAVHMPRCVGCAGMAPGATAGVGRVHIQGVFVNAAVNRGEMQVAIVNVTHMVAVLNAGVPAAGAVRVVVMGMANWNRHQSSSDWGKEFTGESNSRACAKALKTRSLTWSSAKA